MSTHTRTTKSGTGTTEWGSGDTILAAEHNDEWNGFLTDYNGGITNANISGSAGIDPAKIDDYGTNDTEFLTSTTPGDHFSTSLPTDLTDELERLRYRIRANSHGTALKALNAAGSMVTVGWTEPPPVGANLLANPGFELQTGGAGTAPDGWTLSGSPSTCALQTQASFAAAAAGTDKRSLNVIGNAVGITQTVAGLKASTKYRVGIAYVRTANTVNFTTSGGLGGSSNYGDVAITDSATSTYTIEQAIFQTDSSGSDITLSLTTSGSSSAEVNLFYAWLYECQDAARIDAPPIPMQQATDSTRATYTGVTSNDMNYFVHTPLSLSVSVPHSAYSVIYDGMIEVYVDETTSGNGQMQVQLQMDVDGGGYNEVDAHLIWGSSTGASTNRIDRVRVRHIENFATAGSTYSFRIRVGVFSTRTWVINPTSTDGFDENVATGYSRCELELRRW